MGATLSSQTDQFSLPMSFGSICSEHVHNQDFKSHVKSLYFSNQSNVVNVNRESSQAVSVDTLVLKCV